MHDCGFERNVEKAKCFAETKRVVVQRHVHRYWKMKEKQQIGYCKIYDEN